MPSATVGRRRRTPEQAEREILEATEEFLRDRPFRDLTIDEVMDRTGLSRPSFYVYFRDRHHLALRLLEELAKQVREDSDAWLQGSSEPPEDMRAAIAGTVTALAQHGSMMRAISDAATEDADVERAYRGVVESFIDDTAMRIERDVKAGRSEANDPAMLAAALVWMNERYLLQNPVPDTPEDRRRVTDELTRIWMCAIYDG
ncbi:MAG: TetR/AcrR family transcriptional regulator [Thermoleophilaceae bacterium]|nr:TetR/AcrR family transcriptional regulator [Thermoleophilaceae bacterium]